MAALYWGWDEHPLDDFEDFFCGADVLNQAKLNILDRQNRVEEYLGLCLKLGQYLLYVLKQIELGETEKAIRVAETSLTQAPEALQVAQKLRWQILLQNYVLTWVTPSTYANTFISVISDYFR